LPSNPDDNPAGRTLQPELPARRLLDWITRRRGDSIRILRGPHFGRKSSSSGLLPADGAVHALTFWFFALGSPRFTVILLR
jgi:hypothetical protein